MAETTSKIKLIFDGTAKTLVAAAKESERAVDGLNDKFGNVGKYAALAGVGVGGASAAIAAALPAAASLGLQFGVVALAMKANNAESKAYKAQLEALKKPLQDLQNTAGKAFLPGVTKFLKDSTTLFPILDGAVKRTGTIMGDTASKLGDLFKSEDFQQSLDDMLQSSDYVTQAIGDSFVKLTGKIVEFGGNMGPAAEGFGTFIRDLESGIEGLLDGLAPHAADFKSIWESLGSILKNVLPIVGQLAGELAGRLAPILRDVAGFIDRNKDAISSWVPVIGQAVVAIAGLKIALQVAGWVNGATAALAAFGGAASKVAAEGGRGAGITWGKGFIGGLGLVGAGAGATIVLDKFLPADAARTHGSQVARDMLHEMASVFQGEGNIFQAWDVSRWISNPISMAVEAGSRELMKLFGITPPPIPVKVDTQPASKAFTDWQSHVGDGIATAHLDADPSRAMGTVHDWEGGVSRTRGVAQLDADASRGNNVLGGWKGSANATVGTASLNANPAGANSTRSGWQSAANGTVGTARLDANPGQANGALGGWRGSANATVGTARLNANTGAATAAINTWRNWASGIVVTVKAVLSKIGFANGGPVLPGMATGGPISGPGTGTSDQAGMFALSAGEWVMTADQVRRAGGFAGMAKIAAALDRGGSLGLAEGGGIRASARAAMRAPAPSSAGSSGGSTVVQFTGNTSDALATVIMGMIRQGKIQIKAA